MVFSPNPNTKVHTTLYVRRVRTADSVKLGSPVSAILQEGDYKIVSFTSPRDSIFEFVTTAASGALGSRLDSYIEIFEDSRTTKLLAFNDNYNGTGLSRASVYMARGQTVYVRVRGWRYQEIWSICKSMRAEASMTCTTRKDRRLGTIMNSPSRSQAAINCHPGAGCLRHGKTIPTARQ